MTDGSSGIGKGYIQVYMGEGKGKSTAAFGLALRAVGAGLKVFAAQFLKQGCFGEIKAFERFGDLITIRQYGTGRFVRGAPSDEDIESARAGLEESREALCSGEYDVVILDEAGLLTHFGIVGADEMVELMAMKPDGVELVITGRKVDPKVVERADLVTDMKCVKHYFDKGVLGREGIES